MATNNVFRSSTIYGILRNSDNTTASPNVLANAIFDRDVNITGKVVTDRINSKTGRIDMSGNIIDISGNTIYLGHTGANVYIKDVLYAGGDVTLAGNNNFTGTNTFNDPTIITEVLKFSNSVAYDVSRCKIEPIDMGGASVMKITSRGILYIDANNTDAVDNYLPYFYQRGFYYPNPTTTEPYTIESAGGLTISATKLKLLSSGDIDLATASVTRFSTPTLTDNSLELATTAFVKGQGYATLASPTLTGTPAAPTAATSTNTTQIATTAFVKNQGYATLASPTLTGTPLAPTQLAADNSTAIATTAFVKLQNYLTSASLSAYALLASPTFTGTPAAPTAATSTNTTQIATTAFVKDQGYATLASPTLTGTPAAPTATAGTNTTQIATTAFVLGQSFITSAALSGYALLASPTLTGTPAAPTAATSTNTTQIATTAFVKNQAYATLADPALTGNPTATTQLAADDSTRIATTAFVKLQNYLTSAALSGYALLASPTFTGTPAAPTAATSTNTTQIATTAFVKNQAYATLASPTLTGTPAAPTALTADNSTTIATTAFVKAQNYLTSASLSAYALLASPTFTGTPAAPTALTADNSTTIATTAFVKAQNYITSAALSGYALLASPTFTGTPAAPTAAVGTNTTQIATTAFVLANGGGSVTLGGTNAWTGTNSFNTNLPTSTATPSSSTQLVTKSYTDSTYVSLTANNSGFTGDLRGVSMYRAGYNTIAIGYDNLPVTSTSNYDNFCFGTGVMKYMTGGNNNVGVGNYAMGLATNANQSVAVGIQALSQVLTGGQNTAIGFCAAQVTTGSSNTCIGSESGISLTSGSYNTFIGSESGGGSITTGSYNTAIGDNSGKHNFSNTTCIGYNSVATANNQIVLGTTSETTISKGGIEIIESKGLDLRQNSAGNTSAIEWVNNAGSALALIYASTSSNAFNFDAYSSSLTNGFRFLFGGSQVAKISTTGQLSAGQPKYWFIGGVGANGYTPAGRKLGSSTYNVGGYFGNIQAFGGASTSNWSVANGIFTASEDGTYVFNLSVFNNGNTTSGRWLKAGGTCLSNVGAEQYIFFNQSYIASTDGMFSVSQTYYMTSGQTFYWFSENQSPYFYYASSHTCGLIFKIL